MINAEEIRKELDLLLRLKKKVDACMENAPDGTVYFVKTGKNTVPRPYRNLRTNGKRVRQRLTHEEEILLKPLKYKTYARHLKQRIEQNILALTAILQYTPLDTAFRDFGGEPFRECREAFFGCEPSNKTFDMLQERQNPFHPEDMNVNTELGSFRSREEYIAARAMTILGLRFKYETPLSTPRCFHYPDFAVLHPKTGEIIYIEYAGNMRSAQYRASVLSRLHDYGEAGVYLGVNLFFISPVPGKGIDMAQIINRLKGIFEL